MNRRAGPRTALLAALLAVLLAGMGAGAQPRPPVGRPPLPRPAATPTPGDLVPYTVRAGDTCATVALRVFHDARRTDLVHASNDLGPPPHRLSPGQILRLPRRAPPLRGPLPDARLTAAHNRVEVAAPQARPGHPNDPLFRGSRVSTQAQSTAEVTFTDETQLRLAEQTLVVILGDTSTQARRVATARDTTLMNGSLRAFMGTLVGRTAAVPVNTPAARVLLGAGEAEVRVDARRTTTLAVYHGRSRLRTRRRMVVVPEGYSAQAEQGHDPTPPRPLPAAVAWVTDLPGVVFADATGTATVTGVYGSAPAAPGVSPAPVVHWHVQLARDVRFEDPFTDATVPADVTRLEARGLAPGGYMVRVSAVDALAVEGPWSPERRVVVARPRVVPTATAHRSSVELPAGVHCAVDDGDFHPTGVAPVIDTRTAHRVRCSGDATGRGAAETTVPREPLGPFTVLARLVDADPVAGHGRLRVRVLDHAGEPVAGMQVTATRGAAGSTGAMGVVPGGVVLGAVVPWSGPDAAPGVFSVPVRWQAGTGTVALHLAIGDESADTPGVPLPAPPPAPVPLAVAPGFVHRVELRVEGVGGSVLTGFQQNQDPRMFAGVTRGFSGVYGGSARASLRVVGPVGVHLGGSTWVFPSSTGGDGRAVLYSAGVRVAPRLGSVGRLVLDAGAGVVLTGPYTRPGFELGAGVEFAVGRAISLGPVVRYVHVVQPGDDLFPYDAAFWTAGLSVSVRVPGP